MSWILRLFSCPEWTLSSSPRCSNISSCCSLMLKTYRLTWRTMSLRQRHTCCHCPSPLLHTLHLLPQTDQWVVEQKRYNQVIAILVSCFLIYLIILQSEEELDDSNWTCPNTRLLFPDPAFPRNLREPIRSAVDKSCPRSTPYRYVYF